MTLNVQLTGRMGIREGGSVIPATELGGNLGRLLLVRLSLSHGAVPRDVIVDWLWGEDVPDSATSTLDATCSRLRRALAPLGYEGRDIIRSSNGSLEIVWPSGTIVDVPTAFEAIETAEKALKNNDAKKATSQSEVALAISRRELLPNIDRPWLDEKRRLLESIRGRSLRALSKALFLMGDLDGSIQIAKDLQEGFPYSTQAAQALAAALCRAGEIPAAFQSIQDFERRVADELGVTESTNLQTWLRSQLPELLIDDSSSSPKLGIPHRKVIQERGLTRLREEKVIFSRRFHWATDKGPYVSSDWCEQTHMGRVLEGRAQVDFEDGTKLILRRGENFHIPPGHDMRVLDDKPFITDGW